MGAVSAVDGFQRRHRLLGFPIAVVYKYFDDQGPYLASALTYSAFIAIFPLMLLGTSILGLIHSSVLAASRRRGALVA